MPGLPKAAKISAYCAPLGCCRNNANTSAARRPRLSRWATGVPVSRNVTRASMSAVRSCCSAYSTEVVDNRLERMPIPRKGVGPHIASTIEPAS